MVNRGATREYQRSRIQEEVDRLMKKRASVKRPVVVFSMNPSDDGVSFESGFLIDQQEHHH